MALKLDESVEAYPACQYHIGQRSFCPALTLIDPVTNNLRPPYYDVFVHREPISPKSATPSASLHPTADAAYGQARTLSWFRFQTQKGRFL